MQYITFQPLTRLNHPEFLTFCQLNAGLICEMNANGSISLRTNLPKKYLNYAEKIGQSLTDWNERVEEGRAFDVKTGFVLPNGTVRHPSVSWAKMHKLNSQNEHLIEATPDFFLEFLTEHDNLDSMIRRMKEFILNGAHLGWLFDLNHEKVYIFKNDGTQTVVEGTKNALSGNSVLRGYVWENGV